jgi:AcrR family transcriptional regulator
MATARRVRLQIDERRNQLVELGIRIFASRSFEEIAIEDVAAAAGISKGLLYHYFRSKQEFYVEVIRASSLHLRKLTEPDPLLAPTQRLRAGIEAHLNYIQQHAGVYKTIYSGGISVAPEVGEILDEHREVVMRWFLKHLGITKPRPVLRAALRAWVAMVEGASLDWIANPDLERDALRELLVTGFVALLEKAQKLDPSERRSSTRPARRARAAGA